MGLETDNAERFNDFEDNASGGEKNEQKEENENIKMDESDVSYLTRAINAVACFIRRIFRVGFSISICLSSFFLPRCRNMTSSSPVGENNCTFG